MIRPWLILIGGRILIWERKNWRERVSFLESMAIKKKKERKEGEDKGLLRRNAYGYRDDLSL